MAVRQARSPFPTLTHTRLGALRSGGLCCPRHHRYQYGPLRLPLGARPFRRVTAYRLRGYRAPQDGSLRPYDAGAETDLSCSVIGCPTVPLPIPRRIHRRSTSKFFAPSMAFAHLRGARLPLFDPLTRVEPDEAAGFLIVRTSCLLAPQRDFVVTLRRAGLPERRPPATGLLGHYPDRTLTGKSITASPGHTEGRFQDAALGRRRSGSAWLARVQPVAWPLHRRCEAQRRERGQISGRSECAHRCVAHAPPPTTVRAKPPPRRPPHCPGKLHKRSGRMTALI